MVVLVQSWGPLRFDDHRGLLPREFAVTSTGLQARLTRSKVSGSDKHLNYRTVIIHPSAYIQRESWLSVGWKLLQEGAPHERDYLLPAPTNNYQGFKIKELKYSTAFAVPDTYYFHCYLPRIESLRKFYGALLYAPQWPQLHAIGGSSVGFRQS